jgi:hypothetical protein
MGEIMAKFERIVCILIVLSSFIVSSSFGFDKQKLLGHTYYFDPYGKVCFSERNLGSTIIQSSIACVPCEDIDLDILLIWDINKGTFGETRVMTLPEKVMVNKIIEERKKR